MVVLGERGIFLEGLRFLLKEFIVSSHPFRVLRVGRSSPEKNRFGVFGGCGCKSFQSGLVQVPRSSFSRLSSFVLFSEPCVEQLAVAQRSL